MPYSALCDIQAAYNFVSIVYGRAFEMKALLEQVGESIQQDETELLQLLKEAQEKANKTVIVTRETEQTLAQLLTITIQQNWSLVAKENI